MNADGRTESHDESGGDQQGGSAQQPASTPPSGSGAPVTGTPQWQAPQAPADPHPKKSRPRPLTGPIVWGALFLVACAYFTQRAFAPGAVDAAGWITATVIGLGVLLLVVGVAVVIRGGRER